MVRCPRDFRAICTAVAPDAVGTLRIYNPTPPVYDGHFVPCSSDHNRAIMPNCELQPRELLKNVPTRVADPPGGLTSYRDACRRALTRQKRSEEHTSELQSRGHLVCRLLLEKKKTQRNRECVVPGPDV